MAGKAFGRVPARYDLTKTVRVGRQALDDTQGRLIRHLPF